MAGMRIKRLRLRNSASIVLQYFIQIIRYMLRSYDHLQVQIYTSQNIMTGMKFRGFRPTQLCFNSCSLFHSNYPLHVSVIRPSSSAKNTSQYIMTGVRCRGFRLTQLCFISCFIFYWNYQLHVSVLRPSSGGNIYIKNFHGWHEVQAFSSNATLLP
jgi:hypothetical protein